MLISAVSSDICVCILITQKHNHVEYSGRIEGFASKFAQIMVFLLFRKFFDVYKMHKKEAKDNWHATIRGRAKFLNTHKTILWFTVVNLGM